MKMLHTGDWHIGRHLNQHALLEDQRHALGQLLTLIRREQPDVLIVAGDLYDRALAPREAMTLVDTVLTEVVLDLAIPAIVIGGNHDGRERLDYGSAILRQKGLHTPMTGPAGRFHTSQCVMVPSSGCVSSVRTTARRSASCVRPSSRSSGEASAPRPVCPGRNRPSPSIPGEDTPNPGEPLTRPSHEGLLRSHRLSILRLLKWPPTCTVHRRDRGRRTAKGAAVHRRPAFPRRSGADVLGQGRSGIG